MDTETQISQRLAESVAEPKPDPVPSPSTEEPRGDTKPQPESGAEPKEPQDPFVQAQNKGQLMQYLGVKEGSYESMEAAAYVDNILDFAQREVGNNMIDVMNYIRGIEQALGARLSSNRLTKLNQFVIVRNQHRILQAKQEAMLA